jgi:hypothetical protein
VICSFSTISVGARQTVRRRAIPRQSDHVQAVISRQKSGAKHRPDKNPKSRLGKSIAGFSASQKIESFA